MKDDSDAKGLYWIGGMLSATLILGAMHGFPKLIWHGEWWFGQKPVLDYVIGIGGIMVGAIVAATAIRTFRLNVDASISGRFQKGIELLVSKAEAAQIGGITLMSDAARLRPKHYLWPMLNTLTTYLSELSVPDIAKHKKGNPPHMRDSAIEILETICRVPRSDRWPNMAPTQVLGLWETYMGRANIKDCDFGRLRFDYPIIVDFDFSDCDMSTAVFAYITIADRLTFRRCNMRDVRISRRGGTTGAIALIDCSNISMVIDRQKISANGTY